MTAPTLNEQSEKWLVGKLLADPSLITEARDLNPLDLFDGVMRTIFRAIIAIDSEGKIPTLTAVAQRMESDGTLADVDGGVGLLSLSNDAPYVEHVTEWRDRIQRAAVRRRLRSEALAISLMADDLGVDDATLLSRFEAAKEQLVTGENRPRFKTYSMAELDAAEFPMNYLVEGVLVANQPCVIAAGKKSLKTNIACDLTLSLASGSQFLGKFWTPKAVRVAIMTGESGDSTTQETMRRIARSKPWINLADYSNAICSFDLPRLGQPQTRRELERFITDNGLKVLIIDPAYLCLELGDDAGNLFTVGKKLKELTDIGHATGCTIIIIHHNKKSVNDPFAIPELESIAWSGFQEWARQWLLIGRRELYDPEQAGSHRLWLNVGGSAGHSGCWAVDIEEGNQRDDGGRRWEVAVQNASTAIAATIDQRETAKASRLDAKAERQVAADVEKLLKHYRRKSEGDTAKFYREAAGLSGGRANPANAKLLADGLIEAVTITKNGRPYEGFRLVQESTGTSGTDRDSTGTNPACPDGGHRGGLTPLRGSPCPAHRDIENSLNEVASESVPLLHEQAAELFPVEAA